MSDHSDRCYVPLTKEDLIELAFRAIEVLKEKGKPINDCKCMVISQNTASHYLSPDKKIGLHDFDIIAFFTNLKKETHQQPIKGDSKLTKFGDYCKQCPKSDYIARKMDIFCKNIKLLENMNLEDSVKEYFKNSGTKWIKEVGKRPIVCIVPEKLCGKTLWSPDN
jgi:hypothetical protein